jgi:uncharacterized protein YggU (UPF0235/DUF167 family)
MEKFLIKVNVAADSKKEKLIRKGNDEFIIKVREKAERGQANKKTIILLSLYFKVPAGKIHLIKGAKQKSKIFEVLL